MKALQRYLIVSVMILVASIGLPIIFPAYTKPDGDKIKKARVSLVLPV